jgi:hypothetical protein
MTFSEIDSVLVPWASRRQMQIFTQYKDEEVRSMLLVDDQGDTYQLWVDRTDPIGVGYMLQSSVSGSVPSRVWKQYSGKLSCEISELETTLDRALDLINACISSRGHTRTPVR